MIYTVELLRSSGEEPAIADTIFIEANGPAEARGQARERLSRAQAGIRPPDGFELADSRGKVIAREFGYAARS
jgi:hypothetical protein